MFGEKKDEDEEEEEEEEGGRRRKKEEKGGRRRKKEEDVMTSQNLTTLTSHLAGRKNGIWLFQPSFPVGECLPTNAPVPEETSDEKNDSQGDHV